MSLLAELDADPEYFTLRALVPITSDSEGSLSSHWCFFLKLSAHGVNGPTLAQERTNRYSVIIEVQATILAYLIEDQMSSIANSPNLAKAIAEYG